MPPYVGQLAEFVLTTALGILVGWAMKGARAARERSRQMSEQQVRERDEMRADMRMLLGFRLSDLFRRYVVAGEDISTAEKHEAEDLYLRYHGLGGNGEGTRKYRAIMALKTTD